MFSFVCEVDQMFTINSQIHLLLVIITYEVNTVLLLLLGSYAAVSVVMSIDASRYCWSAGSVSWGENYAGSSGLASPKPFTPLHFMQEAENIAAVCSNVTPYDIRHCYRLYHSWSLLM